MSAKVKRGCLRGSVVYLFRRLRVLVLPLVLAQVALARPASARDYRLFFQNSAADKSYFYSEVSVVAPSECEVIKGKLPVDVGHFKSPPNSLRLKWKSAAGGDWHATLKVPDRYVRDPQFGGDTLSLLFG